MSNIQRHKELCDGLHTTYQAKNKDYGNSWSDTFREYGAVSALVRMQDKWNRIKTLLQADNVNVKDESVEDTLLDFANYCLMTVMELEGEESVGDFTPSEVREIMNILHPDGKQCNDDSWADTWKWARELLNPYNPITLQPNTKPEESDTIKRAEEMLKTFYGGNESADKPIKPLFTVDDVMACEPCYTRNYVQEIADEIDLPSIESWYDLLRKLWGYMHKVWDTESDANNDILWLIEKFTLKGIFPEPIWEEFVRQRDSFICDSESWVRLLIRAAATHRKEEANGKVE